MKAHTEILYEEQWISISNAYVPKIARYFKLALGWLQEVENIIKNRNELVM